MSTATLPKIAVGDTVRYSSAFLKSTGSYTSGIGSLRGKVVAVTPPAAEADWPPLITVRWNDEYFDTPVSTVLASNLQVKTGDNRPGDNWLPRSLL